MALSYKLDILAKKTKIIGDVEFEEFDQDLDLIKGLSVGRWWEYQSNGYHYVYLKTADNSGLLWKVKVKGMPAEIDSTDVYGFLELVGGHPAEKWVL